MRALHNWWQQTVWREVRIQRWTSKENRSSLATHKININKSRFIAKYNDFVLSWRKGPFALGGIPPGYRATRYPAGILGGKPAVKPLASCKWVTDFSLETRYLLMLFVILQDDDNDKESTGVCGCSRHYTEKRNDVGELCTLVRGRIVPLGPRIFRICQNFTSAVCA